MSPELEDKFQDGSQPYSLTPEAYHAVIVPESGEAFTITARTAAALATELQKFYGTRTAAFPFLGQRWFISKGPTQRYLLGPNGERFALFKEEPNYEPDPDGSLSNREDSIQEKVQR